MKPTKEPKKRADKPKKNGDEGYIDLFSDEEDIVTDEPVTDASSDGAEPQRQGSNKSRKEFTFDRYGRRVTEGGKRAPFSRNKQVYGKRKDAPKAATKLVTKETIAERELSEAMRRAEQREKQRRKQLEIEERCRREERRAVTRKRLSILAAITTLGLIMCGVLYFTFLLKGVDIEGTLTRSDTDELVSRSGLVIGRHMLFQDLDGAKTQLEQDPYIKAEVKYVFPNRIQITVIERQQRAAVMWGPSYEFAAIIDGEGVILESTAEDYGNLVTVRGLSLTRATILSNIGAEGDEQVQGLLDVLAKMYEYGISQRTENRIVSIDVTEIMAITMQTENGYSIQLGTPTELDTKFRRLSSYWDAVMQTAGKYAREGSKTVTVYLYSKDGVVVSPYSVDHVKAELVTGGEIIPGAAPTQDIVDPNATPSATTQPGETLAPSTPAPTDPPFVDDPFTG